MQALIYYFNKVFPSNTLWILLYTTHSSALTMSKRNITSIIVEIPIKAATFLKSYELISPIFNQIKTLK